MKNKLLILLSVLISTSACATKIQQQGVVTHADCVARGVSDANCILLDSQVWDSTHSQLLSVTIAGGFGAAPVAGRFSNAAATSTGSTIVWSTVDFDTSAAYNNSTGVYTAPSTGYYELGVYTTTGASTSLSWKVFINGTGDKEFGLTQAGGVGAGNVLVKVNAGDTITVQPIRVNEVGGSASWLSIFLVH